MNQHATDIRQRGGGAPNPYPLTGACFQRVGWADAGVGGVQIGTTKGTGGDILILEEAAYCDPEFFYETLAPILLIERTSLLAISTLTSEINFYTRLIKMRDPATQEPIFHTLQIQLACEKCKKEVSVPRGPRGRGGG